jgi:hypothetical protein
MVVAAEEPMAKRESGPGLVLPVPLAEAIKSKRAIVFLGAGASKESKDAKPVVSE